MTSDAVERRLAAILSADAVGYSRLMAADEAATVQTLGAHRRAIEARVRDHGGRVVDAPGDNLLAEFPSVVEAVRCAIDVQRDAAARNAELPAERRMAFRIGVHVGDLIAEGERIYGDGVNVAARLEGLAEPGGLCISGEAYDQVRHKLALPYRDRGEQSVKNIPHPVRVYRVGTDAEVGRAGAGRSNRRAALVAAAALLAAITGVAVWQLAPFAMQPGAIASRPRIASLAVLPLDNLSAAPEQEYFTDGMTEALIAELGKLRGLRVTSRTSVMPYKRTRKSLPQIAGELGVDAIVEGSVLRAGDSVRITAQLIDARDDRHLWSESYARDLRDVLALQSEVAHAIARQVELEVAAREPVQLASTRPVDPDAYEAYLKGRYFLVRSSEEDHRKAVAYFQEAVRIDPDYAPAWAGLADGYT